MTDTPVKHTPFDHIKASASQALKAGAAAFMIVAVLYLFIFLLVHVMFSNSSAMQSEVANLPDLIGYIITSEDIRKLSLLFSYIGDISTYAAAFAIILPLLFSASAIARYIFSVVIWPAIECKRSVHKKANQ